jgi:single-strand DNA-binding protein
MKSITLGGTVGKDAVMRRTQGGEPVLGFSVAVDDGYGENKSTMWFDIALWGKRGDALAKFLKKGTKVCVTGEFGQRHHEGKTYFTCRASDITLMGGGDRPATEKRDSYGNQPANLSQDMDDTIPF